MMSIYLEVIIFLVALTLIFIAFYIPYKRDMPIIRQLLNKKLKKIKFLLTNRPKFKVNQMVEPASPIYDAIPETSIVLDRKVDYRDDNYYWLYKLSLPAHCWSQQGAVL